MSATICLAARSLTIKRLFDLDGEGNIPAWFSTVQIFLIGIVWLLRSRQSGPAGSPSALFFMLVGFGFIFLSADEMASIHEKATGVLKHFDFMPRFKDGHGIWISLYLAIGVVLMLISLRSLIALWKRHRRATCTMGAGMAIAAFGVIVLEVISYQFLRDGSRQLLYTAEVVLEEFLETFGASVMLYGALLLLPHDSTGTSPKGERKQSA